MEGQQIFGHKDMQWIMSAMNMAVENYKAGSFDIIQSERIGGKEN